MKISKRLKAIAEMISKDDKILDIGCDHSLLGIYLKQTYDDIKIIASDINQGAIKNAKKNIEKYKLDGKIDLRLGDGLSVADSSEFNTIVISGMGYYNIVKILSDKQKLETIDKIIIQSNTDVVKLRKAIIKLGYKISREQLVEDNEIIYTIIEFVKGYEKYNYSQIYFGPRLMENKDDLFIDYYSKKLLKYENLLLQLPKNKIISRLHHKRLIRIIKEEIK